MKASLLSDEVAMLEILHRYQFIDHSEQPSDDLTFLAQVNEKLNEETAHCKLVEIMLHESEEDYSSRFENADALVDAYFHWHFGALNKNNREFSLKRSTYLLPTGVMMSQIRGRKLAEGSVASPQNARDLQGVLETGIALLEQPSMPDSLAIKMREVARGTFEGVTSTPRCAKQLSASGTTVRGLVVEMKSYL